MRAELTGACKSSVTIGALAATNGQVVSAQFDTFGFDYMSLDVILGTSDSTSDKPTVVKLTEADVTTSSSGATIAAFYMSTDATAAVAPSASSSVANVYRFDVDLLYRKRYLFGYATPSTTQAVFFSARLVKGSSIPVMNATNLGVQNALQG
jgi:hypothetical protein